MARDTQRVFNCELMRLDGKRAYYQIYLKFLGYDLFMYKLLFSKTIYNVFYFLNLGISLYFDIVIFFHWRSIQPKNRHYH